MIKAHIQGGAWITAAGAARMGEKRQPQLQPGPVTIPPAREIFNQRLPRYGRYDRYTRLGCACIALALRDAGMDDPVRNRQGGPLGLVCSSAWDCFETDMEYYRTTAEEGGALASPNLFSYTVPGVMLGEAAIIFGLTGPTFCLGNEDGQGLNALRCALRLIASGAAETVLAGWTDILAHPEAMNEDESFLSGSVFVVLTKENAFSVEPISNNQTLCLNPSSSELTLENSGPVQSILDVFPRPDAQKIA